MKPKIWTATLAVLVFLLMGAVPATSSLLPGLELPAAPLTGEGEAPEAPTTQAPAGSVPASGAPAATPPAREDEGGLPLPPSPYTRLLQTLVANPTPGAKGMADMVRDYYHDIGFPVPSSSSVDYEDNATMSFSHELRDVSGDGTDDLLLDQYCNESDACREQRQFNLINPFGALSAPPQCGWPHRLYAISGTDGSELWNRTLDLSTNPIGTLGLLLNRCVFDFVVGMVPAPGGANHILMYRFTTNGVAVIHEVYLLNGTTGHREWRNTFVVDGYVIADPFGLYVMGWNFLLNPLLQAPRDFGVPILPAETQTGLLIQSVGFNITGAGLPPLPWAVRGHTVINSYQPNEWAAGLDPLTGATLWRTETFQPNGRVTKTAVTPGVDLPKTEPEIPWGNRSIVPWVFQDPYGFGVDIPNQVRNPFCGRFCAPIDTALLYWSFKPCCYDLTGDNVPDLLYTVVEFSSTPAINEEGPFMIDERIVLYDGKTGKVVWDIYPGRDIQSNINIRVQPAGDMNGDGTSDFLFHQWWFESDFHHQVTIRDGKTANVVWAHDDKREFDVLVLGDVNKDLANDIAIVNWTFDISFWGASYGLSNVTETPIVVYNGRTGDVIWRHGTFMAPSDLVYLHELLRINRLLDADRDGAADLLFDDPLFLPDLTMIHRMTIRSGADGDPVYSYVTAGAFSFPSITSDQSGDGTNDFLVLNGDINDLWLTTYEGRNGTALWSRRILATRDSSYYAAFPQMRTHPIRGLNETQEDFAINLQLQVTHATSFGGGLAIYTSAKPQLVLYSGNNGSISWAMPAVWDLNLTVVVEGMSPASKQYYNALLYDAALDRVPAAPLVTPIEMLAGSATFVAAFGASFLISGRRRVL